MNELIDLKRKAKKLGLCKEYTDKWDECKDKKDLINTVLDSNGVEFLCDGVQFKWGLTSKFIKENFADFINGNYLCKNPKGYSTELFCKYQGEINVRSTIVVVIDSTVTLIVPPNAFVKVYAVGRSQFHIRNKGMLRLITYGTRNSIGKRWEIEKNVLESEWHKEGEE